MMSDIYKIEPGDTLESIANNFMVKIEDILKINNISYPAELRVGMDLVIPPNKDLYFSTYVVEKGDSLYQIGKNYNINPDLLAALNGLNKEDYIYPNQEILIPKNNYSYYLTDEGDTIDSVIKVFNSTKDKFLEENETIYLMPGQLLINKK